MMQPLGRCMFDSLSVPLDMLWSCPYANCVEVIAGTGRLVSSMGHPSLL